MTQTTATSKRLRDHVRTWAWVVAIVVAVVLTGIIISSTDTKPIGRLDPASVSNRGAHALAQLLTDRGVRITEATNITAVRDALRPDSQLLVVDNGYLTEDDLDELAHLPGDRLFLEPYTATRARLFPRVRYSSSLVADIAEPGCDMREAVRAGAAELQGTTYEFDRAKPGDITCYQGGVLRFIDNGATVTVIGSADFMTNKELAKQGNAALAMNLAGRSTDLVWYSPQRPPREHSKAPESLGDLFPTGVTMAIWQLCIALLVIAWWRGRRLGPVVPEQLPVVVRASETTEGRARLYRSRRARDRAADSLREATRYRIVHRIGLLVDSPPDLVTATVAERTGRTPAEVHYVLFGPVPSDDTQLTSLVQQLDVLERQVRDS